MTSRLSPGWAGAKGALTARAAFAVVGVSGRRRFLACVAIAEHAKIFARPTLATCHGDTGNPVCVAVCLPAPGVSVMASRSSLNAAA
jgi:hypothetical protein